MWTTVALTALPNVYREAPRVRKPQACELWRLAALALGTPLPALAMPDARQDSRPALHFPRQGGIEPSHGKEKLHDGRVTEAAVTLRCRACSAARDRYPPLWMSRGCSALPGWRLPNRSIWRTMLPCEDDCRCRGVYVPEVEIDA